jgi:hypothetical protein
MARFEEDLEKALPMYLLLARHTQTIWPATAGEADIARFVLKLREAGIGDYRRIADNPPFTHIALPLKPSHIEGGSWSAGAVRTDSGEAYLTFTLPASRYVAGIRIECTYAAPETPWVTVTWKPSGALDYPQSVPFQRSLEGTDWTAEKAGPLVIWVGEEIDEFLFFPHTGPAEITLRRIELLTPADGTPRP